MKKTKSRIASIDSCIWHALDKLHSAKGLAEALCMEETVASLEVSIQYAGNAASRIEVEGNDAIEDG